MLLLFLVRVLLLLCPACLLCLLSLCCVLLAAQVQDCSCAQHRHLFLPAGWLPAAVMMM